MVAQPVSVQLEDLRSFLTLLQRVCAGGVAFLLLRGRLHRSDGRRSRHRQPAASTSHGADCVRALGEGARAPPLVTPSCRRSSSVAKQRRSSACVDRLGHQARHRRTVLGRTPRSLGSAGNPSMDVPPGSARTGKVSRSGPSTAANCAKRACWIDCRRGRRRRAGDSFLGRCRAVHFSEQSRCPRHEVMHRYEEQFGSRRYRGRVHRRGQRPDPGSASCRCHRTTAVARSGPYHYSTGSARENRVTAFTGAFREQPFTATAQGGNAPHLNRVGLGVGRKTFRLTCFAIGGSSCRVPSAGTVSARHKPPPIDISMFERLPAVNGLIVLCLRHSTSDATKTGLWLRISQCRRETRKGLCVVQGWVSARLSAPAPELHVSASANRVRCHPPGKRIDDRRTSFGEAPAANAQNSRTGPGAPRVAESRGKRGT